MAPESAPASRPELLVVRGRVVDERRRPAAAVSVELVTDRHDPPAVRTGPDGRFQIEAGSTAASESLDGVVVATDGSGRVAGRGLSGEPGGTGVIDVGTLALEQGGLLAVRVLADGGGVAGAQVYVGETEWLGFGPLVTDAHGLITPRWMPVGSFVVRAFSGDRGLRGESPIALPRKSEFPLDVVLVPARRLRVTVQDAATGRPLEGETLVVEREIRTGDRSGSRFYEPMPGRIPPTDAAGRTDIVGLAPGRVVVKVLPPAPPPGWMRGDAEEAGRAVAEAGTEELVIQLREAGETFTFPIVSDETEGPPDGAEVDLSVPEGYAGAPPPRKGKVVGRTLVIDGVTPRCSNILAIAADGTFAIVQVLDEAWETKVGTEARFKRRRALVVSVHDRAGIPLVGYRVRCRTVGNTSIGPVAAIGSGGTARIEGLDAESFTVHLWRPTSDEWSSREVGAVDLRRPGERYLEVIAERERSCVLHVTVNGEKSLPPSFHVHVEGGDIGPIEEDPEAGTLRFAARPVPGAAALSLKVEAKGCVPVDLSLPLPEGDGVMEGNVALVVGGSVRIHVLPPTDNIHDVSLEFAADESWYAVEWWPSKGEVGHKPTELSFVGLDPGRFRARDTMTGLVSDPLSVAAGSAVEITLDLTHAGTIQGRVEGPADKDLEPATVVISGSGIIQPGDRLGSRLGVPVPVNSDFTARVPGDRAVTFRVTHPVLVPAPESGSVTVTAPGASVVLKLVRP